MDARFAECLINNIMHLSAQVPFILLSFSLHLFYTISNNFNINLTI